MDLSIKFLPATAYRTFPKMIGAASEIGVSSLRPLRVIRMPIAVIRRPPGLGDCRSQFKFFSQPPILQTLALLLQQGA